MFQTLANQAGQIGQGITQAVPMAGDGYDFSTLQ